MPNKFHRFLLASGAIALSLFLSWAPVHSVQRQLSDGWSWSPPTAGTLDDAFQDFVLQFGTVCQGGAPDSWSEGTLRGTTCALGGSECSTGSGTCTEDVGDPVPFDSDIATNQDVRECRGVTVSLNSTAGTAPTDQVVSLFDCSASERTSAASCVYRGKLDSDTPTLNVSFARGFVLAEVNTTGVGGVIDIACNTMADRYFDGSVWADITAEIPMLSTPRRSDRGGSNWLDPRPGVLAIGSAKRQPDGVDGYYGPAPLCMYTLDGYPGFGSWAGTGDGSTVTYGHSRCQSGSPGADPTDPTDFSCYCERAWNQIGHSYTIRENTYGGADIYYNPKTRKIVFDTSPADTQEINAAMQYYEDTGCDGGGANCEGGPTDKEGRWGSATVGLNYQMEAFVNIYNDTNSAIVAKSNAYASVHNPFYCIPGNDNCETPTLLNLMTGDYKGGSGPTTTSGRHGVKIVRSFDAETCWADQGVARVCFDGDCDPAVIPGQGPPDNPMGVNGDLGAAPKVQNASSMRKMTGTSQDFDTCIRRSFGPEGGFALSVDKDASIGYWDFQEVTVVMDAGMVTNLAIESAGHPYRSGDGPLIISGGTACHIDDKAAYFASVIDEDHFELAMDYQTAVRGHIRDTQDGPGDPTTSSGRGELADFATSPTQSNSMNGRTSGTCSNDPNESCSEQADPHTHCKDMGGVGERPGAFCYEAPQSFDDNGESFCTITINKKGVEIPITRPVAQGTGAESHGVIAWGDNSDAAFDTGDEVCAAQMMKCQESRKASAMGTDIGCGVDAAESFIASCF